MFEGLSHVEGDNTSYVVVEQGEWMVDYLAICVIVIKRNDLSVKIHFADAWKERLSDIREESDNLLAKTI